MCHWKLVIKTERKVKRASLFCDATNIHFCDINYFFLNLNVEMHVIVTEFGFVPGYVALLNFPDVPA